jgi:hypothetical protein
MINFGLGSFLAGLSFLRYELGNAKAAATSQPDLAVPEAAVVRRDYAHMYEGGGVIRFLRI